MGVILDTSVLIAFERRAIDAETIIQGREREIVGISVVTAAELLHGIHRADSSTRRLKRAAYVEKILDQFTLYPFDLAAARIYAELWATLQKQGIQIGAHDAMIAATAISLGFSIITFNVRDYEKIEGLSLEQLNGFSWTVLIHEDSACIALLHATYLLSTFGQHSSNRNN